MTQLRLLDAPAVAPPDPPVVRERKRLNAAAARVLAYLQVHGSATNVELSVPGIGGLAAIRRVWDLQQRGHAIAKAHVRGGIWKYTLVGR